MNIAQLDQLQAEIDEIQSDLDKINEEESQLKKSSFRYMVTNWVLFVIITILAVSEIQSGVSTNTIRWILVGTQLTILIYGMTLGAWGRMRRNNRKVHHHLDRLHEIRVTVYLYRNG